MLTGEPEPVAYVEEPDASLTVMADFADLKSPWTRGHSSRVAELADAATVLRREAEQGLLDGRAVEWVVAAAGGEAAPVRPTNPGGLTDREVEVLQLLCRGLTNRQVADRLYISAKTVGRHVENIYTKINVSTRAGAAVYAIENRLLA